MSTTPATATHRAPGPAVSWHRRHLLGLEELSAEEILAILDTAESFSEVSLRSRKKVPALQGKVVFNLFFENSTRTRLSFSLAAKRLSADTQDFTASSSSLSKGESFIDTARNIESMGADVMVVRHSTPGAPRLLSQHVGCSIINAGDGAHEHPTQALLDMMTIRRRKGRIAGLTVGLLGDISHSRVARSNIWGLTKLGAKVILCGPPTLVPRSLENLGCEIVYSLDEVLPRLDVINVLRIQFERDSRNVFPSVTEYFRFFGMTSARLARARPDLLLLAPGPINRGIELTPEVADGPNSAILEQVTNGLAVRMAALYLVSGKHDAAAHDGGDHCPDAQRPHRPEFEALAHRGRGQTRRGRVRALSLIRRCAAPSPGRRRWNHPDDGAGISPRLVPLAAENRARKNPENARTSSRGAASKGALRQKRGK